MLRVARYALVLAMSIGAALVGAGAAPGQDDGPTRKPGSISLSTSVSEAGRRGSDDGFIRVGLLLPLSGPFGDTGQSLLRAAQMALFDADDPLLKLYPIDTEGTPDGARAAMRAALDRNVELVLGPLLGTSVAAAAPLARNGRVNVISFSTDRSVAGRGVYLLGFAPEQQVDRVVEYALGQGLSRFGALVPESSYGQRTLAAFVKSVERHGGVIAQVVTYPQDLGRLFGPIRELASYDQRHAMLIERRRELKGLTDDPEAEDELRELEKEDTYGELDFDAIFIPEGGVMLQALAPVLPFYEIDPAKVRYLGTGLWDDRELAKELALHGGWYAGPSPDRAKSFADRFRGLYRQTPVRIASLGYDAVLIAVALAAYQGDLTDISDLLTASEGFLGYDGIFRFAPNGMSERGLAVIEIQANGFQVISPAPETFEARRPENRAQ